MFSASNSPKFVCDAHKRRLIFGVNNGVSVVLHQQVSARIARRVRCPERLSARTVNDQIAVRIIVAVEPFLPWVADAQSALRPPANDS